MTIKDQLQHVAISS